MKSNPTLKDENDAFACTLQVTSSYIVPMVLKAALELGLFDIIAKKGQIPPSEMASHLLAKNKDAPAMLDRMLRLLATHSILTCSLSNLEEGGGGEVERLYGLPPAGELFVQEVGSCSRLLTSFFNSRTLEMTLTFGKQHNMERIITQHMKDAILDGGVPFQRACGMPFYQYIRSSPDRSKNFDSSMSEQTNAIMTRTLNTYQGFEGINSLVDVGGGIGTALELITSKYPSIKGINFDLPSVIKNAPIQHGIQLVAGDMFVSIPKSEAILLKWILHNWDDEQCLKILKNCYEAIPTSGKVILVDFIVPLVPDTSISSKFVSQLDNIMLFLLGGKERTINEFEALSKAAGFSKIQLHSYDYITSVVEIFK
ncbi:hypothetical protein LguiA_018163 [Lonicera macranthoides]